MKNFKSKLLITIIVVAFLFINSFIGVKAASQNTSYTKAKDLGVIEDNSSTSVSGSLSMSGVKLYYKIEIEEAGELKIGFNHSLISSTSSYWKIGVFLEDGVTYYTGPSSSVSYYLSYGNVSNTYIEGIFLETGIYYVVVSNGSKFSSNIFDMTISYQHVEYCETENNSSIANADAILPNINYAGCISSAVDVDYYKITLPESGYIDINLSTTLMNSSDYYYRIRVLLEDGVTEYIGPSANNGSIEYWSFRGNSTENTIKSLGLKAGTYYILVDDATKCNTDKYTFSVNYTITDLAEKESNEDYTQATEMKINTDYVGAIYHSSDDDYYKFTIDKDGYFNVSMSHELNGSDKTNYFLYIYHQDPTKYVCEDTHYWPVKGNENLQTGNIGVPKGTYYMKVVVSTIENTPYTIRVNFVESDSWEKEINSTFQTATNMGSLKEFYGSIASTPTNGDDVDWFRINIDYAENYKLSFTHPMLGTTKTTWIVKLYGSNGTTLKTTGNVKGNESLEMDLGSLSKGIYYLRVSNGTASRPDNYSIKITDGHEHVFNSSATSLLEDGHKKKCTVCSSYFVFHHEWNSGKILNEPTHLETGLKEVTCKACSFKTTLTLPKIEEHNYVSVEKYNSKEHELICVCGHFKYENHLWDEGEIAVDATCITDGEMLFRCTSCMEEKREAIKATHGEIIQVEFSPSTCTEHGHKAYSYCADCNEEIVKKVSLELLDHTKSAMIFTKSPTCTEEGECQIECVVCHEILETQVTNPKGHVNSSWTVDIKPTCTEYGERYINCSVCHIELKREKIDPNGHNYVGNTIEPTCTNDGYTKYTCLDCLDVYHDEIVKMLGHYGGTATCVNKATCIRCNESYGDYDLNVHDYSHLYNDETHHWYECSCGKKQEKVEHMLEIIVLKQPTEVETGLIEHRCVECNHTTNEIIPVLEPAKKSGCSGNVATLLIFLTSLLPIGIFRRRYS